MLSLVKTPDEEQTLMKRFTKIGLDGKGNFDIKKLSPEIEKALEEGAKEGLAAIKEFGAKASKDPLASAKVFGTRAFLNKSAKENYKLDDLFIIRAVGAQMVSMGTQERKLSILPIWQMQRVLHWMPQKTTIP